MKCFWLLWFVLLFVITGCRRYEQMSPYATTPAPIVVERTKAVIETTQAETKQEEETTQTSGQTVPKHRSAQIKGIYVSAYAAGTAVMDTLISEIDRSEINAVVIDLKGDEGFVTCRMDSPLVSELETVKRYIPDIKSLMKKLKEHNIYTIARVAAFRDPQIGLKKPEWCVLNGDGSVYTDGSSMTWINPYKEEAWDYLVEIGIEAGRLGFDEVQFDYIRFCTDRGIQDAVFDERDVQGRSKTDIITEFMAYAYGLLKKEGLYVSADVFGAVIGSSINADAVGQIYSEMAKYLDFISPMIYPSHYADGNFGIQYPDTQPYDTVRAALEASNRELLKAGNDSGHVAAVRPWLQDFTASYLQNYIPYGAEEIRAQIQAVYDSGNDGWMLWNASAKYTWNGLLTPGEAKAQALVDLESRAALSADESGE